MIHTIHGVIENWDCNRQSHKLYVDRNKFIRYLKNKHTKYLSWNSDEAERDVLTIDDSTKAGADACRLAESLGHAVVFFINPYQIIFREYYFINLLDYAIDNRTTELIDFEGVTYSLSANKELRKFRNAVKEKYKILNTTEAIKSTLEISKQLGFIPEIIPDFVNPISVTDVVELSSKGVQIENHGWSHIEIASLSEKEILKDILKTKEWIKRTTGYESTMYAVPFGLTEISPKISSITGNSIFLSDSNKKLGLQNKSCWNRLDITNLINE